MEHIESEDQLDKVLARIEEVIAADVELPDEDPERVIDAVAQWTSVASYAVGRFYGPASPWPRNVAGWGKKAVARLRRISGHLTGPLNAALGATGASSFSISIGFPWGISVGLSWP